MNHKKTSLLFALAGLLSLSAQAAEFKTRVVASGLTRPTGVVAGACDELYFSEVPNPGVPMAGNAVKMIDLEDSTITTLHMGEPEPVNLALDRWGNLYWTCKSAGVILEQDAKGNTSVLIKDLNKPVGIALNKKGDRLYWTEVPTPGVSGANGGQNRVWELNLRTKKKTLVNFGDPEPTDITVSRDGSLYWTCSSAGVIVEATRHRGRGNDKD